MKLRLVLILFIGCGLLVGCNDSLSFEETERDLLRGNIQNFFLTTDSTDGVHIRSDDQGKQHFVYINTANASDKYVSDFDVYAEGSTLFLSYETETASGSSDDIELQKYYVVNHDQNFETLRLIENGEETYFDTRGF